MPNLFKNFLKPSVDRYVFQDVDDIVIETKPKKEEPPPSEAEEPRPEETSKGNSEAVSTIDFAKVQADEIVADAKRQAEEILEQARKRGEEEAAKAREEAHEEGYRQGYGEGLRKAQVEGQSKLEEHCQQLAQEVQEFLKQASAAKDEMLNQTQDELRDLSITIAEKVIHISLKSSQGVIARMIQVATEKLKRREWVHIYVGGYSARELSQITPELMTSLASLSEHIKIIPMPEDESGTCIIEMPDEIIDASASTQLQNIRDLLSEG
ncbi:MAG TPA: F0F1 ATP synthase subunit delta [Candidatus Flavonifractor merdigallinarum]|uniref:F0F1 ATP synthase subunit delta n=1 Tax=Candidatus Flavonifractor merdigallinarum TaxID=2838589 RepID=A0A9D1Y9K4_9FIRM|nr:F0F1 ATP synthase subunit delta [Candidatus Flavonifractor merdigallinarum]